MIAYYSKQLNQCEKKINFQNDLDELKSMKFNASKCQIMIIHRSIKLLEIFYTLKTQVLAHMEKAKYIIVIIT